MALGHVGEHRILDFNEHSPHAIQVRRHWNFQRDAALSARWWNFAIKRETLTALSTPPAFEWKTAFQLPSDFLSVVQLNQVWGGSGLTDWALEGDQLLSHETSAQLRYVCREQDATRWHPLFQVAFAFRLASAMAVQMTGSQSLAGNLSQAAEMAELEAVQINAIQSRPAVIPADYRL